MVKNSGFSHDRHFDDVITDERGLKTLSLRRFPLRSGSMYYLHPKVKYSSTLYVFPTPTTSISRNLNIGLGLIHIIVMFSKGRTMNTKIKFLDLCC